MPEDGPSRCFGFVQTYDEKPKRRLFELFKGQGMQMNQRVMFFSDGGTDIREALRYPRNSGCLRSCHELEPHSRATGNVSRFPVT